MTVESDNEEKKFPEYKDHELSELFRLMNKDELWELALDISKNGLLEPIVLYEGKILDGRNRYTACRMINETPRFEEFDESCDPLDYVISLNLHRRHLTTWQRGKIGLIYLAEEREKAKEKLGLRERDELGQFSDKPISCSEQEIGEKEPHDSLKKAAEKVGIADKTLWQIEKIVEKKEEILELKPIIERLDKGITNKETSIKKAINIIKSHEQIEKLLEIAKKPRKISGTIIHGDFFDKIKKVKDDSIDLLFVDPPYNVLKEDWDTFESLKAYREFCQEWLSLVLPKVKDTGRVYICSSQKHKYKFYSVLQTNLFFGFKFGQEIIWHYKNNMRISNDNEYHYVYDPIFYLYGKKAVKLNFPHEAFKDGIMTNVWTIAIPQTNFSEGKFHKTQKPLELLRRIILTGSLEDDLILDPFAGSGTTGVVCEELQRKYILIEKDPKQIEIAKGRIKGSVGE